MLVVVTPTEFGTLIKRYREMRGLTQRQAATQCGISYRSLQEWESGAARRCLLRLLPKISEGLDLSPEETEALAQAWRDAVPADQARPLRLKTVGGEAEPEIAMYGKVYPEMGDLEHMIHLCYQLRRPEVACKLLNACERLTAEAKAILRQIGRGSY